MGMAAMDGALRRTLYVNGEFNTFMVLGAICGMMILIAWVLYLVNVVMSIGVKGLLGIYTPSKLDTKDLIPAEPEAK